MDSLLKFFEKAFKDKPVLDDAEFYRNIHFISKDLSDSILKDMESLGLVSVRNTRFKRIYNNKKLI